MVASIFATQQPSFGLSVPVNTVLPQITGSAVVGATLTSTNGTWISKTPLTYSYDWLRQGLSVSAPDQNTYVVQPGDQGSSIQCRVTATNSQGATPATSNAIGPMQPAVSPFNPFTVSAGVDTGSGDSGYYNTIYGAIDTQPLDSTNYLVEFATRNPNYTQVAFAGNVVSTCQGWRPIIPGTTLIELVGNWAFDGSTTSATWSSTGQMASGQDYAITWEQF